MIHVTEAEKLIMQYPVVPIQANVPFAESLGMVLAEPVTADRDFPPFTRVAMDGYAIFYDTYRTGQREFRVAGIQPAGKPTMNLPDPGQAIEVMTGAVLPQGADTVIRYEDCEVNGETVTIKTENVRHRQNAHQQGSDRKENETIIPAGTVISSAEIPVLATVGKLQVRVNTLPELAIVSSGDELVPITEKPLPHQIRRSNAYNIKALLETMRIPSALYHLPDKKAQIDHRLRDIFSRHHIVILSGGVSMGKFDYIPEALRSLGVHEIFHKVRQRPGKPFWFGRNAETTVFALPGNPVSSFICTIRYIMPWIRRSIGGAFAVSQAVLDQDHSFGPGLTLFLQVKVRNVDGRLVASPVPGHGSGDLANLVEADGFLELPEDRSLFAEGDAFNLWRYRS